MSHDPMNNAPQPTAPDKAWYGRLEQKVDTVISLQKEGHTDHENRIRSLERARHWIAGLFAAGGATVGALFKFNGK